MKISFVTTVLNEEASIKEFLVSLLIQAKIPDEIIIVDGGSSDSTVAKIQNFILRLRSGQKFQISNFKLIKKRGNRSVGRNEGIKNAKGDIIAVSDVGCVLGRDWLKNITEPFSESSIDVVSGYYKPIINNVFEKCLSTYTCVMEDKINENNFLPSSRSIAFKKAAWKKVGGYPQDLNTCEDLVFAKKLKKAGFKFKLRQDAIVSWTQKENLGQAFIQFFNYAKGDGQARYFRKQTPFLLLRYVAAFLMLFLAFFYSSKTILNIFIFLFAFYILWSILKNYKYVKKLRAIIYLPTLQLVSDVAVICGTSLGLMRSFVK